MWNGQNQEKQKKEKESRETEAEQKREGRGESGRNMSEYSLSNRQAEKNSGKRVLIAVVVAILAFVFREAKRQQRALQLYAVERVGCA